METVVLELDEGEKAALEKLLASTSPANLMNWGVEKTKEEAINTCTMLLTIYMQIKEG